METNETFGAQFLSEVDIVAYGCICGDRHFLDRPQPWTKPIE